LALSSWMAPLSWYMGQFMSLYACIPEYFIQSGESEPSGFPCPYSMQLPQTRLDTCLCLASQNLWHWKHHTVWYVWVNGHLLTSSTYSAGQCRYFINVKSMVQWRNGVPSLFSVNLQRRSDIKGTNVCYIQPACNILKSLAYMGMFRRGEEAALVSFSPSIKQKEGVSVKLTAG
jgi:hypothetical protein